MKKINLQKGIGMLEFLVAAVIFSITTGTVIFLMLDAGVTSRQSIERTQAVLLAQESFEAVRAMRDEDIALLVPGAHGLSFENGQWILEDTTDTIGKFIRTVVITDIGEIPGATGGGEEEEPIDPHDHGDPDDGTIDMCAITVDSNYQPISGAGYADQITMELTGPHGFDQDIIFDIPVPPNTNILTDISGLDSFCARETGLEFGTYYYDPEVIVNGGTNWRTPRYNDQYTEAITTVNDFYSYSTSNDNSNGIIDLSSSRPVRSLFVLNRLTSTAVAGDAGTDGIGGYGDQTVEPGVDDVKQVDTTITWELRPGRTQTISFTEYLTDWGQEVPTEAELLFVNMAGVYKSSSHVYGITIGNTGTAPITIKEMKLNWVPSVTFKIIKINGIQVWSGTAAKNQLIDITDVVIPGDTTVPINDLKWSSNISRVINIDFIMSDDSILQVATPYL